MIASPELREEVRTVPGLADIESTTLPAHGGRFARLPAASTVKGDVTWRPPRPKTDRDALAVL
jgi:hypothetical protein